jgi:nucleoside phosphorylase
MRTLMVSLLAAGIASSLPGVGEARGRRIPGLCATAAVPDTMPPYLAVISAFPGELAPVVAATEIDGTVEVAGRHYYVGRLEGVHVILGLTGIGLVNAHNRTHDLLANVRVAGLVMSAVAGSQHRIADVVLPTEWIEDDRKRVFRPNPALLALASRAERALPDPLQNCTQIARFPSPVCLPYEPAIVLGGRGVSADDFGGTPFKCVAGHNPVLGCDLPQPMPAVAIAEVMGTTPVVTDMETAAVARVAAQRGVPFLAVRAVSDGAGDPLGDRGFPAQFYDYYPLAARNAAVVTRGVVGELASLARGTRGICRLLAMHRWRGAAARIRAR